MKNENVPGRYSPLFEPQYVLYTGFYRGYNMNQYALMDVRKHLFSKRVQRSMNDNRIIRMKLGMVEIIPGAVNLNASARLKGCIPGKYEQV